MDAVAQSQRHKPVIKEYGQVAWTKTQVTIKGQFKKTNKQVSGFLETFKPNLYG